MIFLLTLILIINLNQIVNADKEIFVEIQYSNGTIFKQDLIEYIEEGKIKMLKNCESKIQDKAIMVLGLSGTGKSTLVNYLNDVPLVCLRDPATRKWIIEIAPDATSLPCGFKIGHGTVSETIYPAIHTPSWSDFSYVDNPSFQDTRGIGMEIANSFFRSFATESTNEFKFLLLITHQDLGLRGQQFRDTIKHFSEILGIFDQDDVKTLSKSVAIIVTRVENDGDTDEEMKFYINKQLLDILKEEKTAGRLTINEEKVFNQIIIDKQVEIFSNPKVAGPVSDLQSKQIISLINSMIYFNKEDLQFRVTIAPSYFQTLVEYIEDRYEVFKKDVETILNININYFVNTGLDKAIIVEDVKHIESILRDLILRGSQKVRFETFIKNMDTNILDLKSQDLLIDKNKVIDFFVQLLPIVMQDRFSDEKNYLSELSLEIMLKNKISLLTELYKQETIFNNDIMTIRGYFIKSSEIKREIEKSPKFSYVNVNAYQSVYFDINLNLQNYNELTIISPKWDAEKFINIDLSVTYVPPSYSKASNGTSPGASGSNGLPGLPGKNGGRFFGFGDNFSNLDKIKFNLNGGQGGMGQEGGNGATSNAGSKCTIPSLADQCVDPNCNPRPYRDTANTVFISFGTDALKGGDGGLGGIGGLAGLAGLAKITRPNDLFSQIKLNQIGSPGFRGKDGNGGFGAIGGCNFKCTRTLYWRSWRCCKSTCLGICCDYHTCDSESWSALEMYCFGQAYGLTPSIKNSIGIKPNEIPLDTTSEMLLGYKNEVSQNSYLNFYPSFLNSLDQFIL